jgi:hypothetical protein
METQSIEQVIERIRGFATLVKGWDSYAGRCIKPWAINEAVAFLQMMPPQSPLPFAAPISNGNVQLEWKKPGKYLELEFAGGFRDIGYLMLHESAEHEGETHKLGALSLLEDFAS